jgi:hypothetical protein
MNNIFCPLKFNAETTRDRMAFNKLATCEKQECAWWDWADKCCVIASLALSMSNFTDIATGINLLAQNTGEVAKAIQQKRE